MIRQTHAHADMQLRRFIAYSRSCLWIPRAATFIKSSISKRPSNQIRILGATFRKGDSLEQFESSSRRIVCRRAIQSESDELEHPSMRHFRYRNSIKSAMYGAFVLSKTSTDESCLPQCAIRSAARSSLVRTSRAYACACRPLVCICRHTSMPPASALD